MAWYHSLSKYDWLPYLTLAAVCLTTIPIIRSQLRETLSIHSQHEAALERARQQKEFRALFPEDGVPIEILRTLCSSPVYEIRVAAEKIVLDRFVRSPALVKKLYERLDKDEEEGIGEFYEELNETLKARELSSMPPREEDMALRWAAGEVVDEEISPEENELIQRHEDEIYRRWREARDERTQRSTRRARREAVVVGTDSGDGQPMILLSRPDRDDTETTRILNDLNDETEEPEITMWTVSSPPAENGEEEEGRQTDGNGRGMDSSQEVSEEDREVLSQWDEGYGDDVLEVEPRPRYRVLNEEFEI